MFLNFELFLINLLTAILKSINKQRVIKITIFEHLITVSVFINMIYFILMWTLEQVKLHQSQGHEIGHLLKIITT